MRFLNMVDYDADHFGDNSYWIINVDNGGSKFQYQDGLNVYSTFSYISSPFSRVAEGIFFTDLKNIFGAIPLTQPFVIQKVHFPVDAKIVQLNYYRWMTDKLYLDERFDFSLATIQHLGELGAKLHLPCHDSSNTNYAERVLYVASQQKKFNIVKYIWENHITFTERDQMLFGSFTKYITNQIKLDIDHHFSSSPRLLEE